MSPRNCGGHASWEQDPAALRSIAATAPERARNCERLALCCRAMASSCTRSLARLAILAALGLACDLPRLARAQTAAPDQRIDFDIAAQPLDTALTLYFQRTGVQLLYDSSITSGRQCSRLKGRYAPREALALLLRGTGLIASYSSDSAAVITTPERSTASPAVPLGRVVVREKIPAVRLNGVDRLAYYGLLEGALRTYLREDPRTAKMTFTVSLALRMSDGGTIAEVTIRQGSGNAARDRLIVDALHGRAAPSPPGELAQPLLIVLRGHSRRDANAGTR